MERRIIAVEPRPLFPVGMQGDKPSGFRAIAVLNTWKLYQQIS
ncbi:hypothetical protein [Pseudanabaena sp. PCC 6802]|nr:hypothetical protein [Pseudanabaena sp. PCC 6802]